MLLPGLACRGDEARQGKPSPYGKRANHLEIRRKLAAAWERFLPGEVDSERLGEARGGQDDVFAVRFGIFVTRAVHHANEHRAHVCTILGAMGYEPLDVSAWSYALDTGRSWLNTPRVEG